MDNLKPYIKEILYLYSENVSNKFLVKRNFKRHYGYDLPLQNPKTHIEKVFRRKVHYTPEMTRLTNKVSARDYVSETVGGNYVIPAYAVMDRLTQDIYDTLPDQFVMKTNHGCGFNLIVKDKSQHVFEDLKVMTDKWLETKFHRMYLEFHYKDIQPKLIIEELLCDEHNTPPTEYKCSYFDNNGDPVIFIHVVEKPSEKSKVSIFDENWNYLNKDFKKPASETPPKRPKNLEELIETTKKLAAPFAHVRVDFLESSGRLYVGELTFTPCAGRNELGTREMEEKWGDLWGSQKA